jgi:hypothetical protein
LVVDGVFCDYNQNGVVGSADYVVWGDSLGSATNLAAGSNQNGMIDNGDLYAS